MPDPNNALPDWHRAHGLPLIHGLIKKTPSDFQVTEHLDFDLSDDGEHDFLWVEKEDTNTQWVARGLAEHANVPLRDVGSSDALGPERAGIHHPGFGAAVQNVLSNDVVCGPLRGGRADVCAERGDCVGLKG